MLTRFADALRGYDVFGHLHGKRSLALTGVGLSLDLGTRWHGFLLQHLVGDAHPMVDLVLDRFAADPSLGLVFPEDPNLTGWSLDRDIALGLAARMDPAMAVPRSIDFPIGTMFWARPAALEPAVRPPARLGRLPRGAGADRRHHAARAGAAAARRRRPRRLRPHDHPRARRDALTAARATLAPASPSQLR